MPSKLFNDQKLTWVKSLRDPRKLGLAAFVVIVLLVTWSGVKAVQDNYQLEKQVSELKQQNEVQKLKNQNQKLQNDYYNSDQYLELSARSNFGLAAPGEKVLIVPKDVAMSYVKELPGGNSGKSQPKNSEPFYIRNLKNWWDFFRGHQSTEN